jgi:hypothetical protein
MHMPLRLTPQAAVAVPTAAPAAGDWKGGGVLLLGVFMVLAGTLLVVFAALVAPAPQYVTSNLDLLLSGGGAWAAYACKGAALVAGTLSTTACYGCAQQ